MSIIMDCTGQNLDDAHIDPQAFMSRHRMMPITLMVASFGLLMILVLLRVNMVNRIVGSNISCAGCFNLPSSRPT